VRFPKQSAERRYFDLFQESCQNVRPSLETSLMKGESRISFITASRASQEPLLGRLSRNRDARHLYSTTKDAAFHQKGPLLKLRAWSRQRIEHHLVYWAA